MGGRAVAFSDLRQYISRLEETGEILRIDSEVHPVFEVAALIRRAYELQAPAPFFRSLRGYPGSSILGAPIALSRRPASRFARFAISMGLAPESTAGEIIEEYLRRRKNPLPPSIVDAGPCKENVLTGDAVDLQIFPAPLLHRGDYGPYLATWHADMTKDGRTGLDRWELHRLQLNDKKTLIGHSFGRRGPAANYRPAEFAIAIGTEPVTPWVAATNDAAELSAADIIGGIRGAPLELVRCETVDLAVPATAEIVIEGVVLPPAREIPGPIYHVTAITHRNDPILPVSCIGLTNVDDTSVAISFTKAARILDHVRTSGFPVRMAYCPPEVVADWTLLSTPFPRAGYASELASAVWNSRWGRSGGCLLIVDDDVDITDMEKVLPAISTASYATRDRLPAFRSGDRPGPCALFDRTRIGNFPGDPIPIRAPFADLAPAGVDEKLFRNWHEK